VTELGNFGVQTHPDKSLHDLDFADDIVLLDSDSERANEHLTCLQDNAGYVGLVINLMKTKALFRNCEPTSLVLLEGEVAQVEDFCYLGSMISSPLQDLRLRRGMAWSVFWKLETVWRSQSLNLETKARLFDSLVLSVMLYGAESWPISTQMNQLINSFATCAYRIMTGVKRLDKVRNTTVFTSVSRNELIHTVHDRQLRFLGHMLWNTLSTCQYLCTISANSRHNKTRPSSTKLHGLYREADWNEDQQTRGGVTRPWSLAWTCSRVCWSTTARLERESERERERDSRWEQISAQLYAFIAHDPDMKVPWENIF